MSVASVKKYVAYHTSGKSREQIFNIQTQELDYSARWWLEGMKAIDKEWRWKVATGENSGYIEESYFDWAAEVFFGGTKNKESLMAETAKYAEEIHFKLGKGLSGTITDQKNIKPSKKPIFIAETQGIFIVTIVDPDNKGNIERKDLFTKMQTAMGQIKVGIRKRASHIILNSQKEPTVAAAKGALEASKEFALRGEHARSADFMRIIEDAVSIPNELAYVTILNNILSGHSLYVKPKRPGIDKKDSPFGEFNLGHGYGPLVEKAATLISFMTGALDPNNKDLTLQHFSTPTRTFTRQDALDLIDKLQPIINIDAHHEFDSSFLVEGNNFNRKVLLKVELSGTNKSEGRMAQTIFNDILDPKKGFYGFIWDSPFFSSFKGAKLNDASLDALATLQGSPSLADNIETAIVDKFNGKRKAGKKRKPVKVKQKNLMVINERKSKKAINSKKYLQKPPKIENAVGTTQVNTLDFKDLISYINMKLHDKIKDKNMGKGGAKEMLNYRTGRFARSARLENIDSVRGKMINIAISYQTSPYSVFAPGGHLHKPLRNPELIIRRSIRQLMVDLIAQNLQVNSRVV